MGSVKRALARRGARTRTWLAGVACVLIALVTLSAGQALASPRAAASGGTANPLLVTNVSSGTVSAITWATPSLSRPTASTHS